MQGFALYHLDDYAGELDTMLLAMLCHVYSQCSRLLLLNYLRCMWRQCSALLVEQQSF
jgi:hypothetical protein